MSKKKNKLLIAMCAMCVAFLGIIGALVGVLAASTQSVGSLFSVNYSIGDNVAIAFGAYSYVIDGSGSRTSPSWFTANQSIGQGNGDLYMFGVGSPQNTSLALISDDISLPDDNSQAFIYFLFQNITDKPIECVVTDNCEFSSNALVGRMYGTVPLQNPGYYSKQDLQTDSTYQTSIMSLDKNNSYSFVLQGGQMGVVGIHLGIMNPNITGYYRSTAEKRISFSFQQYSA